MRKLLLIPIAALLLLASPALAETPAPLPAELLALLSANSPAACAAPARVETAESFDPSAQAVCTAQCQGGSTVTCSGTTCSAVDFSCPTQSGYCTSDTEGTKYCPALVNCPNPCPGPTCDEIHGDYCKYGSATCYEPGLNCRSFTCNCYEGQYLCP